MFASMPKKSQFSFVKIAVPLLIAGVSIAALVVISGNFTSIETPFAPKINPFATANQPKLTQNFADVFKAETINTEKWAIKTVGDAKIIQSNANNLRFDLPAGDAGGAPKAAHLTYKDEIDEKSDFQIISVMYKPQVTGTGAGVTGVKFNSSGSENDEGAMVQWVTNGGSSKVSFRVMGPDGSVIESEAETIESNMAVVKLERVNKKYRAYFKQGKDETGDVAWRPLGQERDSKLGKGGKVTLFTHNSGSGKNFPKVIGRFDSVRIAWEGAPNSSISFSDAFANGAVNRNWNVPSVPGTSVKESPADNLVINITNGAAGTTPKRAMLVRKDPIVTAKQGFTTQVSMNKPVVTGNGTGTAGIAFQTTGATNEESAQVYWSVTGGTSKLIFSVRSADGSLVERGSVDVKDAKRLTLRLTRKEGSYLAHFRRVDNDTDFVQIGESAKVENAVDGRINLFASNTGIGAKFPAVIAKFDQVNGTVNQ